MFSASMVQLRTSGMRVARLTEGDHVLHHSARAESDDQTDKASSYQRNKRFMYALYASDLQIVGYPERKDEEDEDEEDWWGMRML